ncbi:MAG: single-stranded-DNA-specific exonuclease RecJ [Desulfobacteraceae bacterium]|nr:single-stranded-DNA-specific exonuclease RecJ [Desulfobacteraceae bacterium]MBC2719362.1 single-stranded-DNA-specific exonuclease RecJ [Desulfobacteraceae bacterium]
MKKHWQILQPDIDSVKKISNALKCNPIIASILINRNIVSVEDAFDFLNPSFNNIRSPFSMKGINTAVSRIYSAIINNEKILIFGDYDVDGITATTILLEFFSYIGANVDYYIPHRIKEGYGLQKNHIIDYALPKGINLIITVDCGSSSYDAVKAAQNIGIDVIITDHHRITDRPLYAFAVVNPKRTDCTSGLDNLAGVGVAFYLLICLRKHLRDNSFWHTLPEPNLKNFCDLVALGTIADMVPLVDENRILVNAGFEKISTNKRNGMKALIEECKLKAPLTDTDDIAFKLAPRLNAPGRIDHAKTAVELLTTKHLDIAKQIAQTLNKLNIQRQVIEKELTDNILFYLNKNPHLLQKKTLVLSNQGWHEGILGIVASRLAKRFFRPIVLISTKDGIGKGSARSVPGIDLYDGLMNCATDLENFGGHSMAAGLKLKAENINLFQEHFEKAINNMTKKINFEPITTIDYELDFDNISDKLIDDLEDLKPFGSGNHEPLFMAKNVKILYSKIVGKNHRSMLLKQNSNIKNKAFNAIHFNIDKNKPLNDRFDKIAFRLRWNHWNGTKKAQIIIEET